MSIPFAQPSGLGGPESVVIAIHDESDVGAARRAAGRLANAVGLDSTQAGSFALSVTEAATNVARYARDGMIVLRGMSNSDDPVVEMIAIDRGPGIRDLGRAMSDGFSTGGTPGNGLGAINRAATNFDLWSHAGAGTALIARFGVFRSQPVVPVRIGVVCTPLAGEIACGDAWLVERTRHGFLVALVDGLGHGPDAAVAADSAIHMIRKNVERAPAEMLELANGSLRPTRGAAIQIATVDLRAQELRSAGVGNISTSVIYDDQSKSIPSQPGIVGHQMPKVREVVFPWKADSLLAMHSDGVSGRWSIDKYPGLRQRDPSLAAAVLYRDFARPRDDATILMLRELKTADARSRSDAPL